jgi:hypothetical protein
MEYQYLPKSKTIEVQYPDGRYCTAPAGPLCEYIAKQEQRLLCDAGQCYLAEHIVLGHCEVYTLADIHLLIGRNWTKIYINDFLSTCQEAEWQADNTNTKEPMFDEAQEDAWQHFRKQCGARNV